jgi:hypothetical protein
MNGFILCSDWKEREILRYQCKSYRRASPYRILTPAKYRVICMLIIICSLDENLHCRSSSVHHSLAERRVPFFKGDGITTVNLGFCLLLFLVVSL